MILSWMLYGSVAAALVAAAASAAEALARTSGRPVRWVWAGAIGLTLALLAAAPMRSAETAPLPISAGAPLSATVPTAITTMNWQDRLAAEVAGMRDALDRPLRAAVGTLRRGDPRAVDRYAGGAWLLVTTLLIVSIVGGQARIVRARRRWPVTDMHGVRVRLAPRTGPIVIGLARPEIVVPHWLLARSPLEQRLVIAHEAEHVRALDTLLLAAGCLAIALVPWCAAVWYMFSRLRLAVELDCDARVLRAGAAPKSYGSLLIDVAEHASNYRIGATALVAGPSHLQRRLMAMKPTAPRFARLRGVAALALCSVALLAACEAKMPTSADVDALDAREAEVQAQRLAFVGTRTDSNIVFVVDGTTMPRDQAMALKPAEIATVNVHKSPETGRAEIAITTLAAAQRAHGDSAARLSVVRKRTGSDSALNVKVAAALGGKPLVFIDGVRATEEQFKAIDRNSIASVEILKGPAAAERFSDPDAANGVITITTKK